MSTTNIAKYWVNLDRTLLDKKVAPIGRGASMSVGIEVVAPFEFTSTVFANFDNGLIDSNIASLSLQPLRQEEVELPNGATETWNVWGNDLGQTRLAELAQKKTRNAKIDFNFITYQRGLGADDSYRGSYPSLGSLQSVVPVGNTGDYAGVGFLDSDTLIADLDAYSWNGSTWVNSGQTVASYEISNSIPSKTETVIPTEVFDLPVRANLTLNPNRVTNVDEDVFDEYVQRQIETAVKQIEYDNHLANDEIHITSQERVKMNNYKGYFTTIADLSSVYPSASAGDYAVVGQDNLIYVWNVQLLEWVAATVDVSNLATKDELLVVSDKVGDIEQGDVTVGKATQADKDSQGNIIHKTYAESVDVDSEIERLDISTSANSNAISNKQDKTDNNLTTDSKDVVGAINEINTNTGTNATNIENNSDAIGRIKSDIELIDDDLGSVTVEKDGEFVGEIKTLNFGTNTSVEIDPINPDKVNINIIGGGGGEASTVEFAEDSGKLGGQSPTFYAKQTDIDTVKTDIDTVKTDIDTVKTDIDTVKSSNNFTMGSNGVSVLTTNPAAGDLFFDSGILETDIVNKAFRIRVPQTVLDPLADFRLSSDNGVTYFPVEGVFADGNATTGNYLGREVNLFRTALNTWKIEYGQGFWRENQVKLDTKLDLNEFKMKNMVDNHGFTNNALVHIDDEDGQDYLKTYPLVGSRKSTIQRVNSFDISIDDGEIILPPEQVFGEQWFEIMVDGTVNTLVNKSYTNTTVVGSLRGLSNIGGGQNSASLTFRYTDETGTDITSPFTYENISDTNIIPIDRNLFENTPLVLGNKIQIRVQVTASRNRGQVVRIERVEYQVTDLEVDNRIIPSSLIRATETIGETLTNPSTGLPLNSIDKIPSEKAVTDYIATEIDTTVSDLIDDKIDESVNLVETPVTLPINDYGVVSVDTSASSLIFKGTPVTVEQKFATQYNGQSFTTSAKGNRVKFFNDGSVGTNNNYDPANTLTLDSVTAGEVWFSAIEGSSILGRLTFQDSISGNDNNAIETDIGSTRYARYTIDRSVTGAVIISNELGNSGSITFKQGALYNLTEKFGAGNEPTIDWCIANLPFVVQGIAETGVLITETNTNGSTTSSLISKDSTSVQFTPSAGDEYSIEVADGFIGALDLEYNTYQTNQGRNQQFATSIEQLGNQVTSNKLDIDNMKRILISNLVTPIPQSGFTNFIIPDLKQYKALEFDIASDDSTTSAIIEHKVRVARVSNSTGSGSNSLILGTLDSSNNLIRCKLDINVDNNTVGIGGAIQISPSGTATGYVDARLYEIRGVK